MRVCGNCGVENADSARFCGNCGHELSVADNTLVCPSCGAYNNVDASFCAQCGAELAQTQPTQCPSCGEPIEQDAKFCGMCGAAIGAPKKSEVGHAEKARSYGKQSSVKSKAFAFEAKHGIIINALVIACALVVIFVSLFVPIKISVSFNFDSIPGSNSRAQASSTSTVKVENIEVEQSVWQLLGAIRYISLDVDDDDDVDKIKDIIERYSEAVDEAEKDYWGWRHAHTTASETKCKEVKAELLSEYLSDVNILGFYLALTTHDVINNFINPELGSDSDVNLEDQILYFLDYVYSASAVSAVEGYCIAIVAIAVAVVSAVSIVIGVVGMVRKRTYVNIFVYLTATLAVTGLGLLLSVISPIFTMSGGLFIASIFAVCAYFVFGVVNALLGNGKIIVLIKRAVVAAAVIVSFFILSGNVLSLTTSMRAEDKSVSLETAPFCLLFDRILFAAIVEEFGDYICEFDPTSLATLITSIAFAVIIIVTLYCSMIMSLRALRRTDKNASSWYILVSSIALLLFAVVPAIIGSTVTLPASVDKYEIAIICKIQARAQVYVSMGLTLAAFVLAKLFEPQKKASGAVAV